MIKAKRKETFLYIIIKFIYFGEKMMPDSQQNGQRTRVYTRGIYTQKLKTPLTEEPLYRNLVVIGGYTWEPVNKNKKPDEVSTGDWVNFFPPEEGTGAQSSVNLTIEAILEARKKAESQETDNPDIFDRISAAFDFSIRDLLAELSSRYDTKPRTPYSAKLRGVLAHFRQSRAHRIRDP